MTTDAEFEAAIAALQDWVGRERIVEDEIGLSSARRIAGMLDMDPASLKQGDALPPHWFTMFFPDIARQSDIGPDGHPEKGVFLPPIPLPRRMGAGRRVTISGALRIGEPAIKRAIVAQVAPKIGRTGRMAVLTMRHVIETRGEVIAVDEFDALYREAPPPGQASAVSPPQPAPANGIYADRVLLSSALVFRYSAVTWNAHRIHYDADYARQEEGYPAAVQNGGLTMQLVLDAALKRAPGRLTGFTARLTRPLWVGDTVTLCGAAPSGGRMACWAADKDGHLCATMELEFAA
jgi:3-methylfumaryl-CoA hydratase